MFGIRVNEGEGEGGGGDEHLEGREVNSGVRLGSRFWRGDRRDLEHGVEPVTCG